MKEKKVNAETDVNKDVNHVGKNNFKINICNPEYNTLVIKAYKHNNDKIKKYVDIEVSWQFDHHMFDMLKQKKKLSTL